MIVLGPMHQLCHVEACKLRYGCTYTKGAIFQKCNVTRDTDKVLD
jgi:hypothetical protein